MRRLLTSGRRRYALALCALGASIVLMGNQCAEPTKPPAPTGLSIAPSSHEFPPLDPLGISAPFTFTVTNNGSVKSGALAVALQNNDDFMLDNNLCTGKELDPTATCNVDARFSPTTTGFKITTLVVSGNPGGQAIAELRGISGGD